MDPFATHEILSYAVPGVVMIVIGYPLVKAISTRLVAPKTTAAPLPPDVTARLARIEAAVESIAVEVERISEAQRFSLKISEKPGALPPGSS